MKKLPCLFKREFHGRNSVTVLPEITPGCEWVFSDPATRCTKKFDGTAVLIKGGELFKRYDAKRKPDGSWKVPPLGHPCEPEPDQVTGHWPHWVLVDRINPKPEDKWIVEAYFRSAAWADLCKQGELPDGTYEACGPKIGGNAEGFDFHCLERHGGWRASRLFTISSWTKDAFGLRGSEALAFTRSWLEKFPSWEGFVFHRGDNTNVEVEMCKIRRADFGLQWPPYRTKEE